MVIREMIVTALHHLQTGRLQPAEEILQQVLQQDPTQPGAVHLLGVIAHQRHQNSVAIELMRRSIALAPELADFHNNLGNVLVQEGKLGEAIHCFRRAIELRPNHAEAHSNLGAAFEKLWQLDAAVACQRKAIGLRFDYAEAYANLGSVLRRQGKVDEAAASYRQAVQLQPTLAEAYNGLGATLQDIEQVDEAIAYFERAATVRPGYEDALKNRSLAMLLSGRLEEGWNVFDARAPWNSDVRVASDQPLWDGSDLAGRTILLRGQYGLGDTFQYVRYAPLVAQRSGRVILEVQPPLRWVLKGIEGVDTIVARGEQLPKFDVYAPLLHLPGVFGTTLQTIPANMPYLQADQELMEHWRRILDAIPGIKVGIAWRADRQHQEAEYRCIPLEEFEPPSRVAGVRLISLQKGAATEVQSVRQRFEVIELPNLDEESGPFMDTAAVMKSLDLVISTDTSVAHLAGALGVPVWVAIPVGPDSRWLLRREDSPWYPTMRLFRQKRRWQWGEVFERMAEQLKAKAQ